MTPAIDVRDAFRIYPSAGGAAVALQGLTLLVERGEVVVALGPSGSGKTTLLRTIGGFEALSAGSVRVVGSDLGRLGPRGLASFRAANLGFLDQHYARALSPDLTCRDTVALQLELLGGEPRESRKVADGLLERVGLEDRGGERPQTLSGGEQQRVALCAAIAHKPLLLLADEPVGELDPENASVVYGLVAEMTREAGATSLVVSHDPGAEAIADRVVTISDGRVVAEAVPGQDAALVVSRGWVHVPKPLLRELGDPSLLAPRREGDELALRSAGVPPAADSPLLSAIDGRTVAERAEGETPVAELRAVGKRYRSGGGERVVFENLSQRIGAGSFLTVVGRSGTGKTTLLHLLAGLERPTSGDVFLLGRSLAAQSRSELAALRRRHVSLVTQEPGLVPYLSAAENLALGLRLRDDGRTRGTAVGEALEEVGLEARLEQRASSLSAGERQRVAIARALVTGAELLLVDEPTARLDQENGLLAGRLLERAAHERGRAVVCATHDPALIELADAVVELGAPRQLPVRVGVRTR